MPDNRHTPLQRGLASGSYLIYDDPFTSKYFKVKGLQDSYGVGNHIFTIDGCKELVPGSMIYYEFVDAGGELIKIYGVENPDQAPSYAFSFTINDSTNDGIAILSIVGSTKRNNKNRSLNNLVLDLIWKLEVRINRNKNIDFNELVAVDNLQYASGNVWLGSGTVGTSSENCVLLSWESMYSHVSQYCTHADNTVSEISNYKFKQTEKYYVYVFIPSGNACIVPNYPPAYAHSSGNWILHGVMEASRLSSSQYDNPTRSIYYFANDLPENKHITFWVGTGKGTTLRMKSNASTQKIAFGTPTFSSSDQYWNDNKTYLPTPD